jgi:YbgC/YbaW family acyl-CoA thioester hydrolase
MPRPYEITIREAHLDSYGHVNNAAYLEIYEEARWEIVTRHGFGLLDIHRTGIGPIILELNLKFIKEILLREKILITTELISYEGKICKLKQQMIKVDGTVASEAVFTLALFDLKARKLILPTPEWMRAVKDEG